jgi:hypothetical protein
MTLDTSSLSPLGEAPDPNAVRRSHIAHESSIKSIGILYFLGSAFFLYVAISAIFENHADRTIAQRGTIVVVFSLLAAAQIIAGIGLRKLDGRSRILAGIFSSIGLLAIPIGTIINGYILYLLFSKKGVFVFSDSYKEVVAASPDVKYKHSIFVKVFFVIILLVFAIGIVASLVKALSNN